MSLLSGGQMHPWCRGCFIISFSLSNSHRSTFLYFTISKPSLLLHPLGLVTWVLIELGTGWARNLAWGCNIDLIAVTSISTNIPMISNDGFKVNCNGWILHNKRVRTSYKLSLMITKQRSVICNSDLRKNPTLFTLIQTTQANNYNSIKFQNWGLKFREKSSIEIWDTDLSENKIS